MTARPTVLLLHGLARTPASLRKLEGTLQAAGYATWNGGYDSRHADLPALAADVLARVRTEVGLGPVAGVTHSFGGILARHIGPGLVRMPREEQALADAKATIVPGDRVGRASQVGQSRSGLGHPQRAARMAQRSGKSGWKRVARRYSTPLEPPVPVLVPIVRSTIFTWR